LFEKLCRCLTYKDVDTQLSAARAIGNFAIDSHGRKKVCVCVCVHEREREKERERERENGIRMCYSHGCKKVCVYVYVREKTRDREKPRERNRSRECACVNVWSHWQLCY